MLDELNQASKDRQSLGIDFQPDKQIKKLHEQVAKIQRTMSKLKAGSLSKPAFRPVKDPSSTPGPTDYIPRAQNCTKILSMVVLPAQLVSVPRTR